ncbi:hypothetical protein FALCPG4_004792 [Fusarium falciforme]
MMQCCSGWTVAGDNNKLSSPTAEVHACTLYLYKPPFLIAPSYRTAKSLVVPLQPAMTLSPPVSRGAAHVLMIRHVSSARPASSSRTPVPLATGRSLSSQQPALTANRKLSPRGKLSIP